MFNLLFDKGKSIGMNVTAGGIYIHSLTITVKLWPIIQILWLHVVLLIESVL